ncbi:ParB/RepB/Spo0J family partition protein [Cognatiyoonia sp. IB215182]|uniref:ParB/RepB/Spo0J family partition protein n=1 Tax=Cognatiyoonia sp. IB215182 TaxID=3097353 RepID=UPI002A0AA1DF|nr:ParB N-terminal domain-containing protein [Cognatiyoonia sp. IB215182]MDX8354325.1 ParB N-terminal domain-containing protein [Cognatiyoonia sp. IB215182]
MKPVKEIKVVDISLDEIEVGNRIRMVSPSAVNVIAMSIEDLAVLTDPIHVRKIKNGYRLIDGAHRVAAVKKLGWSSVPTKVWQCTADQAELMESDANISTTHLPPLELAVSLAARKKTYEKLHPETRRGHAGAAARWSHKVQTTEMSFASWMADLHGVTKRHIERIISAGDQLTSDQIRWLRNAPKQVTMADLQTLAKTGDDSQRSKVCIALNNGEAKSAAAAIKRLRAPSETPDKDPVEQAFTSLRRAWDRAPKAARKRFLSHHASDIYDFLIAEGMIQ